MAGGLLSLKWNNHATTFLGLLENLHYKDDFSDASLACEGKIYPVHKFVLSVCSDYFKSIFENTPQWKQSVVVLKDISCSEVEALLSYMYIGEVNVVQDHLPGLLRAAECLRVKGLAVADEKCSEPKNVSEPHESVSFPSTSNVMKQTITSANSRSLREKRPHSTAASQLSPSHLPPLKKNRRSDSVSNPVGSGDSSTPNELQQFSSSNSMNSNYSSKDTNVGEVCDAFNGEGRKKVNRKAGSTVNGTNNNNMARDMKFEECIVDDVVTVKPEPVDSSNQLPEAQDITQNWSAGGSQCAPVSAGEPSSSSGPAGSAATSLSDQSPSAPTPAARSSSAAPEAGGAQQHLLAQTLVFGADQQLLPSETLSDHRGAGPSKFQEVDVTASDFAGCGLGGELGNSGGPYDIASNYSGQLQNMIEAGSSPLGDLAEYVESIRGQRKLVHRNYIYLKDAKSKQGVTYWHCELRGCKARARTDPLDGGEGLVDEGPESGSSDPSCWSQERAVVTVTQGHNHAADANKADSLRKNMAIKNHFRLAGGPTF